MNILIKETGELRSLSFIDWHDGQEHRTTDLSLLPLVSGTPSSEAITISNLYAQHLACSRFPKLNTIRSYTSNFFVF